MLQEHDLKLDGVFDVMAIILHANGVAGSPVQLVDQSNVGLRFAERRDELLSREAEALRSAIMRCAENNECALFFLLDVRLIGRQVSITLNGKKIIDKQEIDGLTAMANNPDEGEPGPITVQGDHRAVEFRSLVVTPLVKK